jgi:hypothetical protein
MMEFEESFPSELNHFLLQLFVFPFLDANDHPHVMGPI